jgi:predicted CoA-binding protein
MTRMDNVRDFLAQKRFAVVGVSRQPKDFSRALFREFQTRHYQPVPVHPDVTEIEGVRCFAHLRDIQPPVDSVLLMTSPTVTDVVVRECVEAGIKRVWFYRGASGGALTASAQQMCEANGIRTIPGECPFMFLDGTPWFHRLHGLVKKIVGAYPR